jgi:hypothetical protein
MDKASLRVRMPSCSLSGPITLTSLALIAWLMFTVGLAMVPPPVEEKSAKEL